MWPSFFTSSSNGRNGTGSETTTEQQALRALDDFSSVSTRIVPEVKRSLEDLYDYILIINVVHYFFLLSWPNNSKACWEKLFTVLQQYHINEKKSSSESVCIFVLKIARFLVAESSASSPSSITSSEVESSDTTACIVVPCRDDGAWFETLVRLVCQEPPFRLPFEDDTRILSFHCLRLFVEKAVAQDRLLACVGPAMLRGLGDLLLQRYLPPPIPAQALLLVSTIAKCSAAASAIWIKQGLHLTLLQKCYDIFIMDGRRPPPPLSDGGTTMMSDYLCVLQSMLLSHGAAVFQLAWRTTMPFRIRVGGRDHTVVHSLGSCLAIEFLRCRGAGEINHWTVAQEEEDCMRTVLDFIEVILEQQQQAVTLPSSSSSSNNNNTSSWIAQFVEREFVLVSTVWDLAIVGPRLRTSATLCAVPSTSLQIRALRVASKVMPYAMVCTWPGVMDRLLQMICYGEGGSIARHITDDDRRRISLAAVHLFRQTLVNSTTPEYGNEQAVHAFERAGKRLSATAQSYLLRAVDDDLRAYNVQVPLMGSLLALGVLVPLFRPTLEMNDIVRALAYLSRTRYNHNVSNELCMIILRFLGEWMQGDPTVVYGVLSHFLTSWRALLHPSSAWGSSSSISRENVATLVLSLASWDTQNDRTCCWSPCDQLCDLLMLHDKNNKNKNAANKTTTQTNAAGLTILVSRLGALVQNDNEDGLLPWSRDEMEAAIWLDWCRDAVLPVWQWGVRELALFASSSSLPNKTPTTMNEK